MNRLTVYSNGTAVFNRTFTGKTAQIAVQKTARDAFIRSFRLYGQEVSLAQPVSWPQDAASKLTLDSNNALLSLVTQLSGRQIRFPNQKDGSPPVTGTIVGVDKSNKFTTANGEVVETTDLVVLTDKGVQTYRLTDLREFIFPEADVQGEVNKALTQAAVKLRPDTTTATVSVNSPIAWQVQYEQPFPVWQPTYRLDLSDKESELEVWAKLDYDYDDDLPDCEVTVVVGEPDTFQDDLGEPKHVQRNRVNLVKTVAQGGHIPQAGFEYRDAADDAAGGSCETYAGPQPAPTFGTAASTRGGFAAPRGGLQRLSTESAPAGGGAAPRATITQAQAREIGDFSTWTCEDRLTLKSRTSCLVPLVMTSVKAERVLYYKYSVHPERPKLGVSFTNPTAQSLGIGSCSVYIDNSFSGSTILQATKPNETNLAIYGTETGVRVLREEKDIQDETTAYSLSKGVRTLRTTKVAVTTYRFKNLRPDAPKMVVEHDRRIAGSDIDGEVKEQTASGVRVSATLKPGGESSLTITERKVVETEQAITIGNWGPLFAFWTGLGRHKQEMAEVQTIYKELEAVNRDIQKNNEDMGRNTIAQGRVQGYLKDKIGSNESQKEWEKELYENEKKMRACEKRAEELNIRQTEITGRLQQAIEKMEVKWEAAKK